MYLYRTFQKQILQHVSQGKVKYTFNQFIKSFIQNMRKLNFKSVDQFIDPNMCVTY